MCMCVCMCVCVCVRARVCVWVCVYVCAFVCVHMMLCVEVHRILVKDISSLDLFGSQVVLTESEETSTTCHVYICFDGFFLQSCSWSCSSVGACMLLCTHARAYVQERERERERGGEREEVGEGSE